MQAREQGAQGNVRHQTVPRTLLLITHRSLATEEKNEENAGEAQEWDARRVLLIKGAPTKRLWANRYNGVGGHVEAHESVLAAAQRELTEETGLTEVALTLRGIIHIDTGGDDPARPGVMLFVFVGESESQAITPSAEGTPEWIPLTQLDDYPLLDDLYAVIPLALNGEGLFYGHYTPRPDGSMSYQFTG
jgi:8-oxo-dGTP diphosphatase